MNMISQLRQRIARAGTATITTEEFNQLQAEWITRTKMEKDELTASPVERLVIKPEGKKEEEIGPNKDGCHYGAQGGWCDAPDSYKCYSKLKQDNGNVGCLEALERLNSRACGLKATVRFYRTTVRKHRKVQTKPVTASPFAVTCYVKL